MAQAAPENLVIVSDLVPASQSRQFEGVVTHVVPKSIPMTMKLSVSDVFCFFSFLTVSLRFIAWEAVLLRDDIF